FCSPLNQLFGNVALLLLFCQSLSEPRFLCICRKGIVFKQRACAQRRRSKKHFSTTASVALRHIRKNILISRKKSVVFCSSSTPGATAKVSPAELSSTIRSRSRPRRFKQATRVVQFCPSGS